MLRTVLAVGAANDVRKHVPVEDVRVGVPAGWLPRAFPPRRRDQFGLGDRATRDVASGLPDLAAARNLLRFIFSFITRGALVDLSDHILSRLERSMRY